MRQTDNTALRVKFVETVSLSAVSVMSEVADMGVPRGRIHHLRDIPQTAARLYSILSQSP